MKNHIQRWQSQARRGQELILIGFLPQGGLDLILWTVSLLARAGDAVIALIVCDPSSSLLNAARSQEDETARVERCVVGNQRDKFKRQLGELKQLCNHKQIQMDIKFAGGKNPEKVLVEQATVRKASALVIGTSERFSTWRKRNRSNYLVQNSPAGCSVIIVRNGKVVQYKENRLRMPSEADTKQYSSEVPQFLVPKQEESQEQCPGDSQIPSSSSSSLIEVDFNIKEKEGSGDVSAQTQEIPAGGDMEKEAEDRLCGDVQLNSPSSSKVIEVYFDVHEDEEGVGCRISFEQDAEDRFHRDQERRLSFTSNVIEVHFDVNQEEDEDGVEEDEDEEGEEEGHKIWSKQTGGSSPRAVLEGPASSLDSDSSSSPTRNSFSEKEKAIVTSPPHWGNGTGEKGFRWTSFLRMWKHRSVRRLSTFPTESTSRFSGSNKYNVGNSPYVRTDIFNQRKDNLSICSQIWNLEKHLTESASKPSWKCFTLKEIESATINFSPDNFIGKGGYAEVYKGSLPDGRIVAVKRLNRSKTEEQRVGDFLTEMGIIVHINHPNAARLIGFGVEGGLHIILQFSPRGSLASMLHGPNSQVLDWDIRYRVAVGTAKGLLYLHEGCQRRIIHRDIKASNILLTENFEPQISDFGLAKWLPKQWTHHTVTPIEGTFGYLAPEYFMDGIVDEKTDVFAFGVLLLELITGRQPIDSSQQSLVIWAKPFIDSRNIGGLADPCLGDKYNVHEMSCVIFTAALCVQQSAHLRPCMGHVLQLLTSEEENLHSPEHWSTPFLQSPFVEESSDTEEYTSTRYLSDLNRHRQVALEF